jgi:hypothetical protein
MKPEFTYVKVNGVIGIVLKTSPHITFEHGSQYTCRPSPAHPGHYFSVSSKANPNDLRLMADMMDAINAKEKAESNDKT